MGAKKTPAGVQSIADNTLPHLTYMITDAGQLHHIPITTRLNKLIQITRATNLGSLHVYPGPCIVVRRKGKTMREERGKTCCILFE